MCGDQKRQLRAKGTLRFPWIEREERRGSYQDWERGPRRTGPPGRSCDLPSSRNVLMTVGGAGAGVALQGGGAERSGRPNRRLPAQMPAKPWKTGQTGKSWMR